MSDTRRLALGIEAVSWSFVALGVGLPFAFHTTAFAVYREALVRWAYGAATLPAGDGRLLGLMLGITGGSMAGKWIVHALLAHGPLAEGRAWARDLTLRGLAAWFLVDSAASLRLGATFNVWMINLAPMFFVGLPLMLAHRRFREHTAPPAPMPPGTRACFATALAGAAAGAMIAFGGDTVLFAPWFAGLEAAQYGGRAIDASTLRLALFFFGPVGGCTLAQFLMLAGFVRHDGGTGRAAVTGSVSIAAWCTIDSAFGLAHDGLFNVAMVNLPALMMTLPPWLWLLVRVRRARGTN